ncbi:MAG: histidinol-phosphate transaminase [Gemmatimonadota bacterium]
MTPFPRESYRPLTPYAPDRRPIELDLSDNTSRWGVHPAALAALKATAGEPAPEALLRYPAVYADGLRQAVAQRYGVPVECVATGCGSDDLLDSTFRAAGEPGEEVRYLPPTFSMVEIFARMNGMIPTALERTARLPDLPYGALPHPEALMEGSPALVYLCRPNNPTGEEFPREWVEAVLEAGGPQGPLILLDEAYADYSGSSFLEEAPSISRLLVLRTLSKVYGLAGLRVGFAVGSPQVIQEVEKSRGPYKVNRLAEGAAVAALNDAEGWCALRIADAVTARESLRDALLARGLAPLPSRANFLLLPLASPQPMPSGSAAAVTAALREQGVAVRPFPDLPGLGDAIRISVGPPSEMERFLAALDAVLP